MSNSIKVHELPVSEIAQENDYVLTSLSQTTKRISFKNMMSKISFQTLKTTAKNLLDAINENKAGIDAAQNSLTQLNTNLGGKSILFSGIVSIKMTNGVGTYQNNALNCTSGTVFVQRNRAAASSDYIINSYLNTATGTLTIGANNTTWNETTGFSIFAIGVK